MSVWSDNASLSSYPDAESMSIPLGDDTFYSVSLAPKFDHDSSLVPDIPSQTHREDFAQSVGLELKELFDNPLDFYRAEKEIALPFIL